MVTRNRLRIFLLQLALWLVSAGVVAYFSYHAVNGDRGLTARAAFEQQIASLKAELADVQHKRRALEEHVNQLDPATVDRDLLDEEARRTLGWLHPNDRIVALPR